MAQVASQLTAKIQQLLAQGLTSAGAQVVVQSGITLPDLAPAMVVSGNVSSDLAEKTTGSQYPLFRVSCERVSNTLREKFRTFSGQAQMVVEATVTQDRLEGIEDQLHGCVEAVTAVLDQSRGDWGGGSLYNGGYDVNFSAVRHGGKNFLQAARISVVVDVSR